MAQRDNLTHRDVTWSVRSRSVYNHDQQSFALDHTLLIDVSAALMIFWRSPGPKSLDVKTRDRGATPTYHRLEVAVNAIGHLTQVEELPLDPINVLCVVIADVSQPDHIEGFVKGSTFQRLTFLDCVCDHHVMIMPGLGIVPKWNGSGEGQFSQLTEQISALLAAAKRGY